MGAGELAVDTDADAGALLDWRRVSGAGDCPPMVGDAAAEAVMMAAAPFCSDDDAFELAVSAATRRRSCLVRSRRCSMSSTSRHMAGRCKKSCKQKRTAVSPTTVGEERGVLLWLLSVVFCEAAAGLRGRNNRSRLTFEGLFGTGTTRYGEYSALDRVQELLQFRTEGFSLCCCVLRETCMSAVFA